MSSEINQIELENYGKCVSISNKNINVIVAVDSGPKIIFFGFKGGKNMLYAPYNISSVPSGSNSLVSSDLAFKRYGHQILAQYETGNTAFLSFGSAVYSILPDGVSFSSSDKNFGLSIGLEIILQDNTDSIMVVHSIENTSDSLQSLSICSSCCVSPGGDLLIPQNLENIHNTPNRILSFWPDTDIKDSRLNISNDYILFHNISGKGYSLKLGINNKDAWCSYVNGGVSFLKHYLHNEKAKYLNFDSSFVINSDDGILSLDILSPIYETEKNEVAKMVEYWSLSSTISGFSSENEIFEFIKSIK